MLALAMGSFEHLSYLLAVCAGGISLVLSTVSAPVAT